MLGILRRTLLLNPSPKTFLFLGLKSPIKSYSSSSQETLNNSLQVKSFLKSNGFTENQITRIVQLHPKTLRADPEKTLAPKIDFFHSKGILNDNLTSIFTSCPILFYRSLQNQLIPCYDYLKSVLISDGNVNKFLKINPRIFLYDVDKVLAPNFNLLIELGAFKLGIQNALTYLPRTAHHNHAKFKSKVEEVIRMGFDPTKSLFFSALAVLCVMKKETLDRKWGAFRKSGLTDGEIDMAFRSHPACMELSEGKIAGNMDFLVNKMGFETVRIARAPAVLFFNLENRIIPRCRVVQVLISKGYLKKDTGLTTFLSPSEPSFLKRFVSEYEGKVPELLNIYKGC